jgi:hypothetical protein
MSRFNKESNRGVGEPQVRLITFGGRARFMMPRAAMRELGPMSDLVPEFPLASVAMALSAPGLGMLGPVNSRRVVRPELCRLPVKFQLRNLRKTWRWALLQASGLELETRSSVYARFPLCSELSEFLRVSVGRSERNSRCYLCGQIYEQTGNQPRADRKVGKQLK